jgi:hypothetical protein
MTSTSLESNTSVNRKTRRNSFLDRSRKTNLQLLSLSVILGLGWGLFQVLTIYLVQPLTLPVEVSTLQRVVIWVQMALRYFVTPLAFYLLGRRELPGFRTRFGLAAVYFGSLIGEAGVQAPFALLRTGSFLPPPFPFTFLPAALLSLNFLFPAFSGFALARLSRGGLYLGRTLLVIPLAAMAFALPSNFIHGYRALSGPNVDFLSMGIISLWLFLITLPVEFLVFYALGQMFSLRGQAFRAFGLLFIGAYVGTAIGTALAVALFGQAQWGAPPGGTTYWQDGLVFTNMSNSLVTLLEGLNPISVLPFLSFFGLTLSQVGMTTDEPMAVGPQVDPRATPGSR